MSTPTLPQGQKILSLVPKDATNDQVQNLIENGDLFRALFTDAGLSNVDRSAFMALLAPPPKQINWRPVADYGLKLREWSDRFGLGLTDVQIDELVAALPDHAGPRQPTSIGVTSGKGLEFDRKVVQPIIKYELAKIGVTYTDYIRQCGLSVKYLPGSEPVHRGRKPQLAPALLDIGTFWDTQNGVVVREARRQYNRWPGLEVDWLMALNPQVLAAIDYKDIPGFIAAGLVVDSDDMPSFYRAGRKAYVIEGWDGIRWYGHSVVAFREC